MFDRGPAIAVLAWITKFNLKQMSSKDFVPRFTGVLIKLCAAPSFGKEPRGDDIKQDPHVDINGHTSKCGLIDIQSRWEFITKF